MMISTTDPTDTPRGPGSLPGPCHFSLVGRRLPRVPVWFLGARQIPGPAPRPPDIQLDGFLTMIYVGVEAGMPPAGNRSHRWHALCILRISKYRGTRPDDPRRRPGSQETDRGRMEHEDQLADMGDRGRHRGRWPGTGDVTGEGPRFRIRLLDADSLGVRTAVTLPSWYRHPPSSWPRPRSSSRSLTSSPPGRTTEATARMAVTATEAAMAAATGRLSGRISRRLRWRLPGRIPLLIRIRDAVERRRPSLESNGGPVRLARDRPARPALRRFAPDRLRRGPIRRPCPPRRSGGSRGRCSGRSAARGRGPAGAGSWRAGR